MQRLKNVRLEEVILFGSVALLVFSLTFREVSDADIWFDLVAGADIFSGRFLRENYYSYVDPHHPWLNLHWLYDVILFIIVKIGGIPLAVVSAVLIWLLIFRLLWLASSAEHNPYIASLILALSALTMVDRFVIRSELASYFFLALFMAVPQISKTKNSPKILWLLPLAQALWANMHSYWIIGAVYLIAIVIGARLASFKILKPFRNSLTMSEEIKKALTKISLICLIMPILNPYLLKGYFAPFVISHQLKGGDIFREFVAENKSPFHEWGMLGNDFLYLFILYACVMFISSFIAGRNVNPVKLFFSLVFFLMSIQAQRIIPLFAMMSAPLTIDNLSNIKVSKKRAIRHAITGIISVGLILIAISSICGGLWLRNLREIKFGCQLSQYHIPTGAVAFIKEHRPAGKVFNTLDYGGYLLWEFRPDMRVFFDGRMEASYSAEALKTYLLALQNSEEWEKTDKLHNFGAVLLNPSSKADQPLIEYLASSTEWQLVYLDWTSLLFVKKSINSSISPLILPQENEKIPPPPMDRPWALISLGQAFELLGENTEALQCYQKAGELFPNYPIGWDSMGRVLFSLGKYEEGLEAFKSAINSDRRYTPALYNLGSAYLKLGRYGDAIKYLKKAVDRSPGYIEARMNLAAAYLYSNDRNSALEQYKKILKLEPTNQNALKMINMLSIPQ